MWYVRRLWSQASGCLVMARYFHLLPLKKQSQKLINNHQRLKNLRTMVLGCASTAFLSVSSNYPKAARESQLTQRYCTIPPLLLSTTYSTLKRCPERTAVTVPSSYPHR